jgi:hypothetical protein
VAEYNASDVVTHTVFAESVPVNAGRPLSSKLVWHGWR